MDLHKLLLTKNDCYKAGKTFKPTGVMVHSTGANNPTLKRYVGPNDGLLGVNKNNNHWNTSGTGACVHAFIGKLENGKVATYQTLPWTMRGWHCYKGKNGSGNNTHLSFEICEDGLSDATYFNLVYKEAVELTAYLCKMFSLNPLSDGVVICHSEGYKRGIASNHGDVMHWFPKHGKSMDTFRTDVSKLMNTGTKPANESVKPTTTSTSIGLNDLVKFNGGKQYANANAASGNAAKASLAKVTAISKSGKHPYHLRAINSAGNFISGVYGWVDRSDISESTDSYTVTVTASVLNIRSGPGTNYTVVGSIRDKGKYTIIEEKNGWGRLKSKVGWISLAYTKKS